MDKTMRDLIELGKMFDKLPPNVRGYCEPVELGFIIHVSTIVEARKLHAHRMISWEAWEATRANPLGLSLETALRQIKQVAEDRGADAGPDR